MSLLFLDLDGMKRINDQLGHEVGDDALVEMATLLTRCCRSSDLIARLGGDEFVIMVEVDGAGASQLRDRILVALAEANRTAGRAYDLSCSIGIAVQEGARPVAELLASADQAMYKEKRSHKLASRSRTN